MRLKEKTTTTFYNLKVPEIGPATESLLDEVRNELVTATTIGMKEITDPAAFGSIKMSFMNDASSFFDAKTTSY